MKKGLTTIKFHGKFGKFMGREFKVKISSVKEALRAVDSLSGRKFTKFFLEDKENLNADYRVLVNGKEMASSHSKIDTLEKATESELFMQNENLETIDIIPMVKGSDDFMSIFIIIVGVILIATGIGAAFAGFLGPLAASLGMSGGMLGLTLAVAGIGLVAAGISNLLAEPPKFADFKDPGAKKSFGQSYLFDGPEGTAGEGGPVPIGYGRLIVGGVIITATYEIKYKDGRVNILSS